MSLKIFFVWYLSFMLSFLKYCILLLERTRKVVKHKILFNTQVHGRKRIESQARAFNRAKITNILKGAMPRIKEMNGRH